MKEEKEMEDQFETEFNSQEHMIMDKYIRACKLHRAALEKHLNKTGVYRSQHQLLMYIYRHPDASQTELAKLHNVSAATVAVSLKKLERGGYISRAVDEADNRSNQIRITDLGRETILSSISFFRDVEMEVFAGFTAREKEQLYGYMCRVYENMERLLQRIGKEK